MCDQVNISVDCSQSPCLDCSAPAGCSAGVPTQCVVNANNSCSDKNKNSCCCGGSECCTVPACCYVQPPREQSYKPKVSYIQSNLPAETKTVYKLSYPGIDDCTAKMVRGTPIKPKDNLTNTSAKMDICTVQKLSYQPNCGVIPPAPIKPPRSDLMMGGPIQTVTTQKHDYVPKPICMRKPIKHGDHIQKTTAPLEKCTVNRLSYMPINVTCYPPSKPIKPNSNYQRPEGPVENCTVYRLSYLPNCPSQKENYPWAQKVRKAPPPYSNLGTIYQNSYLPNCNVTRTFPIRPYSDTKIIGSGIPEKDTVYKLSYYYSNGTRPLPIKPKDSLNMPTGKMEQCTVYKLSYIPNCNIERTNPIKPVGNVQPTNAPVQAVTTQKHDYVPKPICKVKPIVHRGNIGLSTAPMETCTVNKLSYMPNPCFQPPRPIKPQSSYKSSQGMPESCTTYKLSYMPVCVPPKESLPWAQKTTYKRPTASMETCTIQKLSYMPPGRFLDKCSGTCKCKKGTISMENMSCFPKAAIVNS